MHQTIDTTNNFALHPTVFVILGITGDLASRKLLPALLALYSKKLLPQRFVIIGFSRRQFSREEFREFIRERINILPGQFKEEDIKHFLDHMLYEQGLFDDAVAYARLAQKIASVDKNWGQCSNKLFHLSVPPKLCEGILSHISQSGLNVPCSDDIGWTRILIEKPFGNDIHAARQIDKLLGKLFKEEQIFRIDHYLAKETLQNIVSFRFSNSMFEPIWQNEFIDKVHIKLFQKNSVEGRGAFYDSLGALRDVGQNHMLQMLALIAMNRPKSFTATDIRTERARVLKSLVPIVRRTLANRVVRSQYVGYLNEVGVKPDSKTETFVRIESYINMPRWKKVPFYLETGKAMSESKAEIDIYFKNKDGNEQNILTFRIQPNEGIKIRFFVKTPGKGFAVEPRTLKFKYSDTSLSEYMSNDYERLIRDAFVGDQTLFASTSEIMASWEYVTPILDNWDDLPLTTYPKGIKEIE